MTKPTQVDCPTCGKKVDWIPQNTYRPFCSERCKLIDLGEWAAEEKRIPGEKVYTEQPDAFNDPEKYED